MTPGRQILLIDDNDEHRRLLAAGLRARDWNVEAARNGREGLELARRFQPDLVVTELILPDVRGFAFGRSLRSAVHRELVVIALTRLSIELHGRALASGFDLVQQKPCASELLHDRMCQLLQPVPRAG